MKPKAPVGGAKAAPLTTRQQLKPVAQNLYRHSGTGEYYGIRKVAGKKRTHALGTADRRTADAKLREWIDGLAETTPDNADLTLAMLVQKFLFARAGYSESVVTEEKGMAKHFRKHFPRSMDTLVSRVVHSDIAGWLGAVKKGGKRKPRTLNHYRLFAIQLFQMAEADRAVKKSPFDSKLFKPEKKSEVKRPIPTMEEFERIIAEIRKPTCKAVPGQHGGQRKRTQDESADFAEFLGRAGVGQAEASSVQWEDVGEREIHFVRQKTVKPINVLITSDLRPLLERRRKAAGGAKASGRVFKIASVKKSLATALERLGLRHYTQRNFRSFKIVGMLDRGVDVKFVAAQQGHTDGGKLILDTYSEVIRANQRAYEDEQLARMEGKVVDFKRAVA